jgi:hypothetical protein
MIGVPLLVAVIAFWFWFTGGRYVSTVLSLGLASLQLMLDRGEQQDWFHSTEIIAELVVACLGIYLFIVHLFTSDNPLIPPRIFRDVNFSAGFLIMFAIGMILLSGMALLPPYLQNLGGPGRAALNADVTRQASIIAYLNDFKFMFVVCLATACLLLPLRRPSASSADTVKHAPIE